MPTTSERNWTKTQVPRGTKNPIDALKEAGARTVELADEWGVTADAVRKLRRFEYVPKYEVAKRMARSFGWTAGDVMVFFAERVEP